MVAVNFVLRPWSMDDLDSLVKYANDIEISKNLTNKFPHPYTIENGTNFIHFATKDNPIHIFAIDIHGEAVGGIGIHPQDDIQCKNAELGYWLPQDYWGRGIISKAIAQIVSFGFKTYDLTRIFARPFGSNIASQKVLEKNGFVLEAKFEKTLYKNGKFEDELIYAVRK